MNLSATDRLSEMTLDTIARLALGAVVSAVLVYAASLTTSPLPTGVGIFLILSIPGFISRSWWSVPLTPVVLLVTVAIWEQTHQCTNCRVGEGGGTAFFNYILIPLLVISIPALCAAVGVLCAKGIDVFLAPAAAKLVADRPEITIGVAIPIVLLLIGFPLHVLGVIQMSNLMVLAVSLLTVGFVTGALLPGWQSIGYVALLGLPPSFLMVLISLLYGPLIDVAIQMLLWVVFPAMVGAVIGVVVSMFASFRRDSSASSG